MAARRMAWSASWMVLCLAMPALADERLDLPALPEPAEVVINATDIASEIDLAALLPLPPEAAPVVLDIAGVPEAVVDATQAVPVPEPALTTAALAPASPVLTEDPPHSENVLVLPELPAAAVVVLDDILPAKRVEGPAITEAKLDPAASESLVPHLAKALASSVRQSWLPAADEREIVAFYEERKHQPVWVDTDGLNGAGKSLTAQLARAAEDGLRTADYALPRLILPRAADLAAADIRLTALAVRYARDARGARIDPRRLSALITPRLSLPNTKELLGNLVAKGSDAGQVIAAYQPQHEGYQALKRKLVELQSKRRASQPAAAPEVRIPQGPAIRVGMRDDRIVLIRARFGFAPDETRLHDRQLATVVAGFQKENGLPANGVLNRETLEAMNGGRNSALEADLIATMERWRWLPADLGPEFLVVNVPEYLVRKVENGQIVHSTRVIVGKSERPTPIFSDMMDHLVMNPSWSIPPTILKQDILPKLASDPGYAERRGFQVVRRGNQISVRQPPGPNNALGNVKFMFPNDHAVYLHDTPSRGLFANNRRAFSSGCVRVEQPLKLAELVLGGESNGWSERRLQGMVGSGERTIRLTRKLPIHIVYMTHVVDPAGTLQSYDDIYGFHRRTREALSF